ncbi:hypothetical protein [Ruegeria jejuensis]|uniref:hypothetical protein n=1 Tax=Ruegeria jejuensis TaxID=3233338 RepID=UPI00355C09BE
MNLKSRISKLESTSGGSGSEVVVFQTLYADRNDEVDEAHSNARAYIIWGVGQTVMLERSDFERRAEFDAEVDRLSILPWEQARTGRLAEVGQ